MQKPLDKDLLEKYAIASNNKVLTSQADLSPKDRAMPEMLPWCKRQGDIAVLSSGTILSSNPSSRAIQNCKIVMTNKGLKPGRVMAATPSLIHLIIANAEEPLPTQKQVEETENVSVQQQRLRILVKEAITADASDIHIEVRPDIAKIRFRKHGELYLHAEWLPSLGREIASVAFNKETDHSVTHFNPLVPQNASMPLFIDGKDVRLRLASLPAHGGFDMVMRILATDDQKVPKLEELGYTAKQIDLIKKAVSLPHGAVIMSGPTGAGKTTTLASAMSMVTKERKVYTIEDPVEKIVEMATQVPVNTEHEDRDFASMGRASLRMDPDVIVLGEMRDEATAAVMVRASITGHLVFSTLHTNTASAIVTRLVDMGISPTLLSDPNLLACLICQRLVPKLCTHCAMSIKDSPAHAPHIARWQKVYGDEVKKIRVRGKCEKCRNSGISGRTVVAEIIWVDEESRRFIQKCDILGWEKYLKGHGWTTYRDQAIDLVRQGICDPFDVEKMVGEINTPEAEISFDYGTL